MSLTIVADDLTGACDAGCLFAGKGRVGVFVAPTVPDPTWEVAVVDTETRALTGDDAARRIKASASRLTSRLGAGRVFKKIDSTMRGPVGAEVEALLAVTALREALVCPAFPDQLRTVTDGVLRVQGTPAHESAVGRDPDYPGPTSHLLDILAPQLGRPISHLPLERVRGGDAALARALDGTPGRVIVADAETRSDLAALARALAARPSILVAGSAGLASALAVELGYARDPVALPDGRAWLIIAGSLHPATRAQVEGLEAAGVAGAWVDGSDPSATLEEKAGHVLAALAAGRPGFLATRAPDRAPHAETRMRVAGGLARIAAGVLARSTPDLVVVTGGETALALFGVLGATRLELTGTPSSGLALGEVVVTTSSIFPVLTKAGGFGAPDLLRRLIERS